MTLWCGGFHSEEEAQAAGIPVRTALMLAGVLLGVGIDVGPDRVVNPTNANAFSFEWPGSLPGVKVSPLAKLKDGQPNERFHPDVHGLQVVPEIKEGVMLFGFLRFGRPVVRVSVAAFEKKVAEGYALSKPLTKKQTLAARLYNESHFFHSSDTARFLTLISAVEALVKRSAGSPAVVISVGRMIEMTAAATDLGESERQSLVNGLKNLKQESVGSACRTLVSEHCGEPAAKDFTRAYKIRSKLLHTGEPLSGTDLAVECLGA